MAQQLPSLRFLFYFLFHKRHILFSLSQKGISPIPPMPAQLFCAFSAFVLLGTCRGAPGTPYSGSSSPGGKVKLPGGTLGSAPAFPSRHLRTAPSLWKHQGIFDKIPPSLPIAVSAPSPSVTMLATLTLWQSSWPSQAAPHQQSRANRAALLVTPCPAVSELPLPARGRPAAHLARAGGWAPAPWRRARRGRGSHRAAGRAADRRRPPPAAAAAPRPRRGSGNRRTRWSRGGGGGAPAGARSRCHSPWWARPARPAPAAPPRAGTAAPAGAVAGAGAGEGPLPTSRPRRHGPAVWQRGRNADPRAVPSPPGIPSPEQRLPAGTAPPRGARGAGDRAPAPPGGGMLGKPGPWEGFLPTGVSPQF